MSLHDYRRVAPLYCIAGLLLCNESACQAADARIDNILAGWQQRQSAITGLMYRLSGERINTPEQFKFDRMGQPRRGVPTKEIRCKLHHTALFDFVQNRHRLELNEQVYFIETGQLYPKVSTSCFDGYSLKTFRPRELNTHPLSGVKPGEPEIGIGTGYLGGAAFSMPLWPIMFGRGVVPSERDVIFPGYLTVQLDGGLMYVHGESTHRGRKCLILRTQALRSSHTTYDELWVDLARGVLLRQLLMASGFPHAELDVEYRLVSNKWLPSSWVLTHRDFRTKNIIVLETLKADDIKVNPTIEDGDFQITERPGARLVVLEHSLQQQNRPETEQIKHRTYRIREDGTREEITLENGVEKPVSRLWPWWLLVGATVVSVVLLALRRHMRTRVARAK
jgi:hypothetical protein